jgi:hypothetical protein
MATAIAHELAEKLREELDVHSALLRDMLKPASKGSVFNTSITADTDIFSSDLSPTNTPCVFRIYACFSASGVLTVRRTRGAATVSEQLNGGSSLNANAAYMFDILVDGGETINLRYSADATCLKLSVAEVGVA